MFSRGFLRKTATENEHPLQQAGAAALAGLGTYAYLRHPGTLPKWAPAEFRKLRQAATQHGYTRVHLHNKHPNSFMKHISELARPADKHVHLSVGRSYNSGNKTKSVVFDPESTHHSLSKHMVGKVDKTVRAISKGKLEEYKVTKKMGLKLPKTNTLSSASTLGKGEIAKPARGSQARLAITKSDIESHNPNDPLLKNFKQLRSVLHKLRNSKKLTDENIISTKLNHHPGYRKWLTERAIKNPSKFVRQPKIDISKEYRVHALHGMPLGITAGRHALLPMGHGEVEHATRKLLTKVHPDLKNNLLAIDIAKDKKGKWHIIETNPGPDSGFLTPTNMIDIRGPHKFYRALTGKQSKPAATVAGLGAAGAAGYAAKKLEDRN
jgi:hypothetical protein